MLKLIYCNYRVLTCPWVKKWNAAFTHISVSLQGLLFFTHGHSPWLLLVIYGTYRLNVPEYFFCVNSPDDWQQVMNYRVKWQTTVLRGSKRGQTGNRGPSKLNVQSLKEYPQDDFISWCGNVRLKPQTTAPCDRQVIILAGSRPP